VVSGNRVVSTGIEWIASQNPLDCHPATLESAMFIHCLVTIMRAGGVKTAALGKEGGDRHLVEAHHPDQDMACHAEPRALTISCAMAEAPMMRGDLAIST